MRRRQPHGSDSANSRNDMINEVARDDAILPLSGMKKPPIRAVCTTCAMRLHVHLARSGCKSVHGSGLRLPPA